MLKGKIIYMKMNEELFGILEDTLKRVKKESSIKIGDIVAMDEHGCRLSSEDEVAKIPEEKIISRTVDETEGFQELVVMK